MIYLNNKEDLLRHHKSGALKNKKVLIVFGDSWTNNTYLHNFGTYPKKSWSYLLAEKLNYDCVINHSWNGGSNAEIFEECLFLFSLYEDYEFNKCKINEFEFSEIKIVIGWSSQVRDFSPVHKLFRPFNVTNIPYINFNEKSKFSETYFKFIDKLMKKEYYQYITQIQTILLQDYFKAHNIDCYFFMAFTPLVEDEFKKTEWDLRQYIDENKFYGLNSDVSNMSYKLNSIVNSEVKNNFVVDQPFYNNTNFISIFTNFFNKKKEFKDYLEVAFKGNDENKYLIFDGHPNELGLEIISNELFEMIDTYCKK